MDLLTLYRATVESWASRVQSVTDDQWDEPTPCAGWTVRDLVNHVVGEDRWTVPLLQGQTLEQVGSRLDGDLLGAEPIAAATRAAEQAVAVVAQRLPEGGTVHLSYGDEQPEEYVRQLAADHLVHGWDLAVATGSADGLDPELVDEVATWFRGREELYRSAGLVGPRSASGGDAQAQLLAAFGRPHRWGRNDAALTAFSTAFASGEVDAIMARMTDDCVFEATAPAPDGRRYEGASAVREVWTELFTTTHDASFAEEEAFTVGDRGVLRWRFTWTGPDGSSGHVRGVDVVRFRDGKVCEKLSYVKG